MSRSIHINSLLRRLARGNRRELPAEQDHSAVEDNVDTILASYRRAEQKVHRSQRSVEFLSGVFGRPIYLAAILGSVALWVVGNELAQRTYGRSLDPPPYALLQGLVTLGALLTSTVVLIKQNRMGRVEAQRTHLALQINLLAEQKVTKVIELLEELRRDLPMVKDREAPELAALKQPADPDAMMVTIEEWRSDTDPGLLITEEGQE